MHLSGMISVHSFPTQGQALVMWSVKVKFASIPMNGSKGNGTVIRIRIRISYEKFCQSCTVSIIDK